MAIDNREDEWILSFIKKAKEDFRREIASNVIVMHVYNDMVAGVLVPVKSRILLGGCATSGFMQRMTTGWVLTK